MAASRATTRLCFAIWTSRSCSSAERAARLLRFGRTSSNGAGGVLSRSDQTAWAVFSSGRLHARSFAMVARYVRRSSVETGPNFDFFAIPRPLAPLSELAGKTVRVPVLLGGRPYPSEWEFAEGPGARQ